MATRSASTDRKSYYSFVQSNCIEIFHRKFPHLPRIQPVEIVSNPFLCHLRCPPRIEIGLNTCSSPSRVKIKKVRSVEQSEAK